MRTRRAWRAWLERHGTHASEIWVLLYKKETGQRTISYADLVEEALCFGWIDSIVRRVDATCYAQRFTPRKRDSMWSPTNIARVKRLHAAGQMTPAGLAAFATHRARVLSPHPTTLPPDLDREFRAHAHARAYFDACPPGYRRTTIGWVASAKKDETRRNRLAQLIAACERGERMRFI